MKKLSLVLALISISVLAVGCDDSKTAKDGPVDSKSADDGPDHAAEDHAAPHGGLLIDLGRNHKYHAEFLDDHETESITVYIYDGDLKPQSISQSSISLVLTNGDNTQTFELPASQSDGSTEFKSSDEKMMTLIDTDGTEGKLRVTINDQPFSGTFELHGHDH